MPFRDSRRPIVAIPALLGFLLAVTAVAYHHHDASFRLPTCSICNVKTSLSGGSIKHGIDTANPGAVAAEAAAGIALPFIGRVSDIQSVSLEFLTPHPHSNRAPPAYS